MLASSATAETSAASLPDDIRTYRPAPGDAENFWRYFFFWKRGVTQEMARKDLLECAAYSHGPVLWARVPERMPIGEDVKGPNGTEGGYGLVGAAIFSLVEGGLVQRIALANMRRCMGFKEYGRYGLSSALWRSLNAGTPDKTIDQLAIVAAGADPSQPKGLAP